MKILADANLSRSLVEVLREAGHDVAWVREIDRAMIDPKIVELAQQEDRIILTADKGFSALVFFSGQPCPGVILVRIRTLSSRNQRIRSILAEHGEGLREKFSVITDHALRIRKIP